MPAEYRKTTCSLKKETNLLEEVIPFVVPWGWVGIWQFSSPCLFILAPGGGQGICIHSSLLFHVSHFFPLKAFSLVIFVFYFYKPHVWSECLKILCTVFPNQNHKAQLTAVIRMSVSRVGLFVKNVFKNITVEPIIFLYLLNGCTYTIVFQNLQIEKACKINLNQTADVCDNLKDPANEDVQNEVEPASNISWILAPQGSLYLTSSAHPIQFLSDPKGTDPE